MGRKKKKMSKKDIEKNAALVLGNSQAKPSGDSSGASILKGVAPVVTDNLLKKQPQAIEGKAKTKDEKDAERDAEIRKLGYVKPNEVEPQKSETKTPETEKNPNEDMKKYLLIGGISVAVIGIGYFLFLKKSTNEN